MTAITPEAWEELNCRIEAVEVQRNNALADHAVAAARLRLTSGKLAAAAARVSELERDLEALKKQLPVNKET